MERNDSNKSMCEELFGGKLEVTVEPVYSKRSNARREKDCLYRTLQIAMKRVPTTTEMILKMDQLCRMEKKHVPDN